MKDEREIYRECVYRTKLECANELEKELRNEWGRDTRFAKVFNLLKKWREK